MSKGWRIAIIVVLAAAIAGAFAVGSGRNRPTVTPPGVSKSLPTIVDLGSEACIPCKMMISVLDELRKEKKGKLEVVMIDVWKNPAAKRKYGVKTIPTQVFYDRDGREFYRHEGFFSKREIISKFNERGIKL
jgi:thioredoxin 1